MSSDTSSTNSSLSEQSEIVYEKSQRSLIMLAFEVIESMRQNKLETFKCFCIGYFGSACIQFAWNLFF